ncbi:MAG: hydroxyacylglutathione hydrolase [Desulforhopalus sp.]|jgi:hydroxyacylglutathione hydrolase
MVDFTQHTIKTPYMVGPVHCYTATIAGELTLFDTGPPTEEGSSYLEEHIDLDNLRHVIVSHCHIDHYGQALWLEKRCNATIYLPYRDGLKTKLHGKRLIGMYRILEDLGFSTEYLEELGKIFDKGAILPPFPEHYLVAEQDIPPHLGIDVLACPGHSQSDLVYLVEDFVISGDTLLKGIFQSPLLDVDLETGERFDNYGAYCETIVKLSALEGKTVLPGHRENIQGIKETQKFYLTKLLVRVHQLHQYLGEKNLMQLIEKLLDGRMKDIFHLYLKASEIVFMMDLLKDPEQLKNALERSGLWPEVAELYRAAMLK